MDGAKSKLILDDDRPGRVRVDINGGVGWIELDNVRKRNAISLAMWRTLKNELDRLRDDDNIRCVVIYGRGEKAFCSGADVAEKQGNDKSTTSADADVALPTLRALQEFSKPTIAMISGYCLGAGAAIALACDLRIVGESASFGIPAARLGLAYYYCLAKRLTEVVGPSKAKEIIFTADRYDANKALRMGLVNEVIRTSELRETVGETALRIARNAPLTVQAAKQAIETAVSDAPIRDIARCNERERACLESEDYAEGRRAFAEKRDPVFQGR
ncbi:short chain enoyl-CoA hydratase [Caballeronia calidae]|uniref:Short chain enoyl-CoA hydratase n=2 Tax=Caballeronia calidae TaxID=1777139 RepID=A0A158E4R1_9BURK|nr:short chain enoyl-CoA hydratase [Caballeronia calidae]